MYDKTQAGPINEATQAMMAACESDHYLEIMTVWISQTPLFQKWCHDEGHNVFTQLAEELGCRPSQVPTHRLVVEFCHQTRGQ